MLRHLPITLDVLPVLIDAHLKNIGVAALGDRLDGIPNVISEGGAAMQSKSTEVTSRNFNPMLAPGLSDEARQAVNAAFDAMSTWRIETANNSEKNCRKVIDKVVAAARALGWPGQIVDAIRTQLQTVTKMEIHIIDHMMDAWEQQIKSPNPMSAPSAMLSNLEPLPGISPAGTWPNVDAFSPAAMNPMQLWIQLAEHRYHGFLGQSGQVT
jgi:hypothetical protein